MFWVDLKCLSERTADGESVNLAAGRTAIFHTRSAGIEFSNFWGIHGIKCGYHGRTIRPAFCFVGERIYLRPHTVFWVLIYGAKRALLLLAYSVFAVAHF